MQVACTLKTDIIIIATSYCGHWIMMVTCTLETDIIITNFMLKIALLTHSAGSQQCSQLSVAAIPCEFCGTCWPDVGCHCLWLTHRKKEASCKHFYSPVLAGCMQALQACSTLLPVHINDKQSFGAVQNWKTVDFMSHYSRISQCQFVVYLKCHALNTVFMEFSKYFQNNETES